MTTQTDPAINEVTAEIDFGAIKQRQQRMWNSGNYAAIGATINFMSELICESVDLRAGQRVLDVATGSGNAALAVARRFGEVTGLDYVPALLERGRLRADAEGVPVTFIEGDAEALPFPDEQFDVVLSVVGVMFAPNQAQVARELVRVCRPAGKIAVANWTPDGFIGGMLKVVGSYVPPPAGIQSPVRWGTETGLRELFGDAVSLQITRREQPFRYRSPEHFADYFLEHYGPTERARAAIDAAGQERLRTDLIALVRQWNTATDGTVIAPGAYLEAIGIRR